jgi:sterol-4alpha-carboxylate 3-dehydrogenase (decarboxylating)
LWDTVYVGNVADAHAMAARNLLSTKTAGGEVFFIQNNEPITFREFSLAIWKEFDHYPPFEFGISRNLGYLVGILAECWTMLSGTPTTISRGSVSDACATRFASGAKAKRILGYEPVVGLEEALKRSCKVSHLSFPVDDVSLKDSARQEYKERIDDDS